ncbi:MAG: ribose-5-phosphate isomerase RpiA [Thermocladium sp.]
MNSKEKAAAAALSYVSNGDVVGAGTGSTAQVFLEMLAEKVRRGELSIEIVPTSSEVEVNAVRLGLGRLVRQPWQVDEIDVAIDGADAVDPNKNLIKGGGGALTREKIIDYGAASFIVIIDESKLVPAIPGGRPIPIEVLPFAWLMVKRTIERRFGGEARLRVGNDKRGPVITDNGNYLLDYSYPIDSIDIDKEAELKAIPGVVEVGIFNGSRVSKLIIGSSNDVIIK